MQNSIKNDIIFPAWMIAKEDLKIKRFYFLPWILSVIFLTAILVYQSIYTYVVIFWKKEEALLLILDFFHSQYLWQIIISFIIFVIFYLIVSPIFEGSLIKYIDSKVKSEDLTIWDCVWVWIYKFLPIFEYNNIFSEFKLISILNAYLFVIRFVWLTYIKETSYFFIWIFLLWMVINLMFSYSKYEIVLGNKNAFQALWVSSKITILNIKTTLQIYLLMFFLNVRVLINFFIFLSFPIIMVLAITLITSKLFLMLAISILLVLFVLLIIILWYLTAVLDVFKASIWYFAYRRGVYKLKNVNEESVD